MILIQIEELFNFAQFLIILIFVAPFLICAICYYMYQVKKGVDEFKQLSPEKKRTEYKICAAFCIITWIMIAIMMILIGEIM